ncbi:hypothetical protein [Streptomyces sp. NPDC004296]|uniref:hypothetical protein n=1 Tax=Streptomyces sp. NPDC004296 TaxID=3364697 RepID=UPI00367AE654
MQQTQVKTSRPKPAATAVRVEATAVTALQSRVAQLIGSGALSAAPHTYHH